MAIYFGVAGAFCLAPSIVLLISSIVDQCEKCSPLRRTLPEEFVGAFMLRRAFAIIQVACHLGGRAFSRFEAYR